MKKIIENPDLLKEMLARLNKVPEIYRPSLYWLIKTKVSTREILKYGLRDFRGCENSIGTSYADNPIIDVRGQYNLGLRSLLSFLMRRVFPFYNIFNAQVIQTKYWFETSVEFKNTVANASDKIRELLLKFKMPDDTVRGGCLDFCEVDGIKIANHYLELLHTHEILSRHIDFTKARTFFEIGGGFGANVHLLIENYPNIRKIVYLDIPPNLYVGTQYLKSFYGKSVKTVSETSQLKIEFSLDDDLEVICIMPDQIEQLSVSIDIFQNSHSFVEMSPGIVKNYAKYVENILNPNKSSIALVSYDQANESTIQSDTLPNYFLRKFVQHEAQTLWHPHRMNTYYIGKKYNHNQEV